MRFRWSCLWLALLGCLTVAGKDLWQVPLKGAVPVPDFQLSETCVEKTVDLPGLPSKDGMILVFKARLYADAPHARGCNYCAEIVCNERPLGRYAGEKERLLGRAATFHLATHPGRDFPVFSGNRLLLAFGPDAARANQVSVEGHTAEFILRLDDVMRGVDGNTITIRNIRAAHAPVSVRQCEIGYLPRTAIPDAASAIPKRGPIQATIRTEHLTLKQGTRGGFLLEDPKAGTLFVETAVGMQSGVPSVLCAEDGTADCHITANAHGWQVEVMATRELQLKRELVLDGGILFVRDRWTNLGKTTLGVPFRYRFFRPDDRTVFYLGGNPDADTLNSEAQNPTLYLEGAAAGHCGWGVAAESDWLRLLLAMRKSGGIGEIYTDQLALDAGQSMDLEFSITPERAGEGYWGFLNALRQRWQIGTVGMEAPLFWNADPYAAPGATHAERIRNGFAHFPKACVAVSPWLDAEDFYMVSPRGAYPKLAADAPRAPGRTPNLDIEQLLQFKHREAQYAYWKTLTREFAEAAPGCGVITMIHPAMVGVYKPLADRWPIAESVILGADGKPFESMTYSRGWFREWCDRDWGVYYYLPTPGSVFFQQRLAAVERMLDECGASGVYSDEFSWSFAQRGYSRYDYRNSDGRSADLNAHGAVARRKSDNAWSTMPFQESVVRAVTSRGKSFFANTAGATRRGMLLPIMRFVEGGNGASSMAQSHLNHVPLVLGNYGERSSLAGLMAAVREALHMGAVYSPYRNDHLLLKDKDNFISKFYPLTVLKLHSDTIIGRERLITGASGKWQWPAATGKTLTLYRYAASGNLQTTEKMTSAAPEIALEVPAGGLVIAEINQ